MFNNYLFLSVGLGLLAFAFPLLLWAGGRLLASLPLLSSLSVYYHTPMRDVFVGILFSIGTFLYLFKGFTAKENIALNLAGIFAVGVALVPTAIPIELLGGLAEVETRCTITGNGKAGTIGALQCKPVHTVLAVAFFLCIGYVCLFRAADTLKFIDDPLREKNYTYVYRCLGIAMVVVPATTACYVTFIQPGNTEHSIAVFIFETLSVWIFASYWILKRMELKQSLVHSVL